LLWLGWDYIRIFQGLNALEHPEHPRFPDRLSLTRFDGPSALFGIAALPVSAIAMANVTLIAIRPSIPYDG
jgi:hypothetical protein